MLMLVFAGPRQSLGKRENKCNSVFGNNWPMNLGGVGDADIARNQFGKHELMHGSRCGVNPLQLLSLLHLLGTELPAYEDFGIGNFVRQVAKIDELNELVVRKLLLETRTEP